MGAQAEVRAVTEHQVRVGLAADVEPVRVAEDGLVPVGRGERDHDLVPRPNGLPAELAVLGGGPAERHHRRPPAQHLVDRDRQQGRFRPQPGLRPGMLEQRDAGAGQAVAQRLVAGHGEQPEHVLELGHGDPAPPWSGALVGLGQQDRHHVVARPAPFLLGQQVGVGVQVGHALAGARVGHPAAGAGDRPERQRLARHRRAGRRVELGRGGVVGVLVADDPVGPVEQQPAVLLGHAEDVGQGQQRHIGGDVLGEVALPARTGEGPVADGPGVAADAVLEPGHRPGRERPAEQAAQPGVLGRVHVEHHPADVAQRLRRGRVPDLGRAERGGEQLRPAQHRLHLGVPEHQPEPGAFGPAEYGDLRHPGDRGRPAQPGQRLERHPGHVGGRVEDDLGVRPAGSGRRVPGRHQSRPRNSSMEVASDTGDSNIG